jgi:hypothetical protein
MHKPLDILVGCEESAILRDRLIAKGHNAISCDLVPSRNPNGPHIQGNVLDAIHSQHWDMGLFFYPCTALAVSGALRFWEKSREQYKSIQESKEIMNAPIEKIAFENPIGVLSTKIRKPDQIIQPWMFGHLETKATCLWLKGLPLLVPTLNVKALVDLLPDKEKNKVHRCPPGPERARIRSLTYWGIAEAMVEQWC